MSVKTTSITNAIAETRRRTLRRAFYLADTVTVARALLGCVLHRRLDDGTLLSARIVETEAYLGANDMASHARRGLRSERNASMYLEGGHAYVYFTYGMHFCLNVVTQEQDLAEAVLLRAAEPVRGVEAMRVRRPKARKDHDLMNGPGKICMAMEIDRRLDGESLRGETLWIAPRDLVVSDGDIAVTPRIGIDNSGDAASWPLRFFLRGNRHVSAYRNV
jgi:DNA-3-methyladenine glycosylase